MLALGFFPDFLWDSSRIRFTTDFSKGWFRNCSRGSLHLDFFSYSSHLRVLLGFLPEFNLGFWYFFLQILPWTLRDSSILPEITPNILPWGPSSFCLELFFEIFTKIPPGFCPGISSLGITFGIHPRFLYGFFPKDLQEFLKHFYVFFYESIVRVMTLHDILI